MDRKSQLIEFCCVFENCLMLAVYMCAGVSGCRLLRGSFWMPELRYCPFVWCTQVTILPLLEPFCSCHFCIASTWPRIDAFICTLFGIINKVTIYKYYRTIYWTLYFICTLEKKKKTLIESKQGKWTEGHLRKSGHSGQVRVNTWAMWTSKRSFSCKHRFVTKQKSQPRCILLH